MFKPEIFWAPDASSAMAPEPAKTKKVYAAISKEVTASIQETREIIRAARRPEFAPALLSEQDVTAAEVDALEATNEDAARLFGLSYDTRKAGQGDTVDKNGAEADLLAAMRRVQTGAQRTLKTRPEMERFYVSVRLADNETLLAEYANNMLELLKTVTLKGVKAPQIEALRDANDAWIVAGGDQSDAGSDALTDRRKAQTLFKEAEAGRRDIQLAAEAQWPSDEPENAGARRAFHIPEHRAYTYVPHD